ncbi:MAG: hypothetical protein ACI4HI_17230 [Lachnospiraceae bacterium]
MKKCMNCGADLPDNALFCCFCGTSLWTPDGSEMQSGYGAVPPQQNPEQNGWPMQNMPPQQNPGYFNDPQQNGYYYNGPMQGPMMPQQPVVQKKKSKVGIVIGIAALVVGIGICAVVFSNILKKKDIQNDPVEVVEDWSDSKETDASDTKDTADTADLQEMNPFDHIEVKFGGYSPAAYADVMNKEGTEDGPYILFSSDFEISKSEGIKLGEEVTVTVKKEVIEQAKEKGVSFTETSKTYTCKDVECNVMDFEEIQDDTLKRMKKKAEKIIQEDLVEQAEDLSVKKIEYYGAIMLTPKHKEESAIMGGKCNLVYTATVAPGDGTKNFKPLTIYLPIEFHNIMTKKNGKQTFDEPHGIDGSLCIDGADYSLYVAKGYDNLKDLKKINVDIYAEDYDCSYYGKLKK